ncbi:hypothetical protein KL86PLE_30397 [uncultured Pleomorphomonas sp.]|uniref:Uncharacterized protein n=1 Tax=uncultured Pleomorphomonas sp. TaxID=442121 RepID=A0A212LEM4_9HYPH|nr:hypothetical protein KL86PLE_30397 [uncultured Pleomorphomonas sp.]
MTPDPVVCGNSLFPVPYCRPEPDAKLYWGGHLASISALPVLTNLKFAPLRFSNSSLTAAPQRVSPQALRGRP